MAHRVSKKLKYKVKFPDPTQGLFKQPVNREAMEAALDKNNAMVAWIETDLPGDFAYINEGTMFFSDMKAAALFRLHYG